MQREELADRLWPMDSQVLLPGSIRDQKIEDRIDSSLQKICAEIEKELEEKAYSIATEHQQSWNNSILWFCKQAESIEPNKARGYHYLCEYVDSGIRVKSGKMGDDELHMLLVMCILLLKLYQ